MTAVPARWLATLALVLALAMDALSRWLFPSFVSRHPEVFVPALVTIGLAVLLIVCLHVRWPSRPIILAADVALLILFALSLRSWGLSADFHLLREDWLWRQVREDTLEQSNELYCYRSDRFHLSLHPNGGPAELRYFLGVWPSRPTAGALERELPFEKCADPETGGSR